MDQNGTGIFLNLYIKGTPTVQTPVVQGLYIYISPYSFNMQMINL